MIGGQSMMASNHDVASQTSSSTGEEEGVVNCVLSEGLVCMKGMLKVGGATHQY